MPRPVGDKLPNGWGLYDMAGNGWEWCADGYLPRSKLGTDPATDPYTAAPLTERVIRGGRSTDHVCAIRAAARVEGRLNFEWAAFRCARSRAGARRAQARRARRARRRASGA
jgi:formylglycine-generating enzyme required for sulfatase activity